MNIFKDIKIGEMPDGWAGNVDPADLAPAHPDEAWEEARRQVYRDISRQCKNVRQPGYLGCWFGHKADIY